MAITAVPFMINNLNTSVLWVDKGDKTKVTLTKTTGESLTISVGDFITYDGRPDGVKIESFTYATEKNGPIGFTYLPWRKEEKRWASYLYSLRGNVRHVIAHPHGFDHYGEHIHWDTMVKLDFCP